MPDPTLARVLADLAAESADLDRTVAAPAAPPTSAGRPPRPAGRSPTRSPTWPGPTGSRSPRSPTRTRSSPSWSAAGATGFDGYVDRAAESFLAPPAELLYRWRQGRADLADALAATTAAKVVWFGTSMSPTSMATARLMETWAHGLDVTDTLGIERGFTPRLRHVAHLGYRTIGHGFAAHGRPRADGGDPGGTVHTGRFTVDVRARRRAGADHRAGAGLLPSGHAAPQPRRPGHQGDRPGRHRVARGGAGVRRTARSEAMRIGNASGFYGDRFSAWQEMLEGGDLDVLTGDYLAELTMLILGRDQRQGPRPRLREDVPAPTRRLPRHRARPRRHAGHQRRRRQPRRAGVRRARAGRQGSAATSGSLSSKVTTCARTPLCRPTR